MDLDHLEVLTNGLSRISEFISYVSGNMFELGVGGSIGTTNFCMLNVDDVAVVNTNLRQGDYAPKHVHDVKLWIIVYRGKVKITTSEGTDVYKTGDYIFLDAGEEHSILALENSWTVTVSVPADPSFPKNQV